MRGLGFEPRNPYGTGPSTVTVIDYWGVREDFSRWLSQRVSEGYFRSIMSTLDRHFGDKPVTTMREMWEIRERAGSKKNMTLALRNLLNYYEMFDLIDEYYLNKYRKVLKTVKTNPDNYIPSTETVVEVYHNIQRAEYKSLFLLLAVSGLRVIEGIKMLNNYDSAKIHIDKNFARYPLYSDRGTKRSYYAYIPKNFLPIIMPMGVPQRGAVNYFHRRKLPLKYLRKWNYNFLIMHNVPESVADFLQGRSPVSVGSMHYLAKVKQADYWYEKVADALVEVFEE